jgi:predicted Ser/Thr protein kinase
MTIRCIHCGESIGLDGSWAGDFLICPKCGLGFEPARAQTVQVTPMEEVVVSPVVPGAPKDELAPGTRVGPYVVKVFIGKGGMGSVYRAEHERLEREVALKVLPSALSQDKEFVKRFEREARVLAKLHHPNIVAVYDMGSQGELCYLVMEFVDGTNLRTLLAQKRLPPEEALKLVPRLCEALEAAHELGVVHRDIKPENILIDKHGHPKVADFGLAKIVKGEGTLLTRTSVSMGTPGYMAPEQMAQTKLVDHRADIYSMGVVLYEMLTGELPIGHFPPPSKQVQVDVRLDNVVIKALEHNPELRYQRASHMGGAVTEIIRRPASQGVAPYSEVQPPKPARATLSWGRTVAVFFVLFGVILTLGLAFRLSARQPNLGIGVAAPIMMPIVLVAFAVAGLTTLLVWLLRWKWWVGLIVVFLLVLLGGMAVFVGAHTRSQREFPSPSYVIPKEF